MAAVVGVLASAGPANAAACTDTYVAGGGDWSVAGNWSKGTLPAGGDVACWATADTVTISTTNAVADSIAGGTLNVTGAGLALQSASHASSLTGLMVTGGSTVIPAGQTLSSGSASVHAGTLEVDGQLTAPVAVTGGTLSGSGSVGAVTDTGGTVAPGPEPSTLTVNGDYSQDASSTLRLAIVSGTTLSPPGGAFARLLVNGNVTLGGRLELAPVPGYRQPAQGDGFPQAIQWTAGSATGGFNAFVADAPFVAGTGISLMTASSSPSSGLVNLSVTSADTMTVAPAGTGAGRVVSQPAGIDCGATCTQEFSPSTQVTLTATPAAGSSFAGWSGGGCGGAGTCTVTLSADTTVTPTFTVAAPVVSGVTPGSGPAPGGLGGVPVNTTLPAITGLAKAGRPLACSTGSWTNSPTSFAYQWSRDQTPIQGATNATYAIRTSDEQLTLTCTVTAANATGPGAPASSPGVTVAVPHVARCPAATGSLTGQKLGLARLGMTRAQVRHAYTHSSNRGKRYEDFFCLTPISVRVGYGSPALPRPARRRLANRVIWASTSSAYYTVQGVRVGATIAAAGKRLHLTGPIHIGLNDWYLAPNGASTAVLKVRGGLIEEIGVGNRTLTKSHAAQVAFLKSFS